jgi:outer membrane protease
MFGHDKVCKSGVAMGERKTQKHLLKARGGSNAAAVRMRQLRAAVIVCAAFGAFLVPRAVHAFPISLGTSSGVLLGGVKEFVYNSGYIVSELDWPLMPAFFAGLKLDLGEASGFLASAELQLGIPSKAGTMTDSDFLNGDGVKTHFSQSDGDLESAVFAGAQAGWGIPFTIPGGKQGIFEPYLAFEFVRLEWTAQNGYLQYPPESSAPFTPWSPSTPQVPIYGTGIIYTQTYFIPALGVKGTFPIIEGLTLTAAFTVSPYMWVSDKDSHLLRQLDFYTTMQGGLLLEPRLSAAFRISPTATVSLDVLYRHTSGLVGDVYVVGTGAAGFPSSSGYPTGQASPTSTNAGGVSLDIFSVTVSVGILL